MQTINPQDNRALVRWAAELRDLMTQRGRTDIAAQIQELVASLENNAFTIAVIGKAKRGKSTLINVFLGRGDDDLAPIDKLPASSTITRFKWAREEKVTVFYRDGRQEVIPSASIRDFVTEEGNPENRRGVNLLVAEGPFANLEHGVELVDTPGAGSIHEYHDSLLHGFIPQADAIVFLVTARMPFDKDELALLEQVKKADIGKIFFAINRVDEAEEEDIRNAISHNEKLLREHGVVCNRFYRISARDAFRGNLAGSGVGDLIDTMNTFLAKEKNQLIRTRFLSRVLALIEPESQILKVALTNATRNHADVEAEIENLKRQVSSMKQTRRQQEGEFELGWEKAVNQFANALPKVQRATQAQLAKKMDEYGAFGVSKLAKELPTTIAQTVESELDSSRAALESEIGSLCTKLQSAYPVLDIADTGVITLHAKGTGNAGATVTTVGGTLGVVGGIALANAGASAAAGIAAANAAALAATAATATAAAEATAVTTMLSWATSTLAATFGIPLGLGGVTATGTAVTGTTLAYTATPLWVAISGPVGWTVAGVGALAIPFAWRCSKLKQKKQLENEAEKQVTDIFDILKNERVSHLKSMGKNILDEFRLNLDRQVEQIQATLEKSKENAQPGEVERMKSQAQMLNRLLAQTSSLETC